jgi:hypothetical protein
MNKPTKEKDKTSTKNAGTNTAKPKDKSKEFTKNTDDRASKAKANKTPNS